MSRSEGAESGERTHTLSTFRSGGRFEAAHSDWLADEATPFELPVHMDYFEKLKQVRPPLFRSFWYREASMST